MEGNCEMSGAHRIIALHKSYQSILTTSLIGERFLLFTIIYKALNCYLKAYFFSWEPSWRLQWIKDHALQTKLFFFSVWKIISEIRPGLYIYMLPKLGSQLSMFKTVQNMYWDMGVSSVHKVKNSNNFEIFSFPM